MNRVIASLLLSLIVVPVKAQVAPDAPQLVVGVTIDQLRGDYLYALQQLLGEEGFKRLLRDGVVCDEVLYDLPMLDKAVSTAAIYSGTVPLYNGIVADEVYDAKTGKKHSIIYDDRYLGNATSDTYSATALQVSTLSDEVKIAGNGLGRVYSVAPDAVTSILAAGHIANSALWIDDNTGRWATTTYYFDAPAHIIYPYYTHTPASQIDTISWAPKFLPHQYTAMPYQMHDLSFRHSFSRNDAGRYKQFKTTPYANRCVTDVAIDLLKNASLGRRGQLDMINIGYTLAPYQNGTVQQYGLELQDAYVRLDAELSRLFEAIETTVGLDKTLFFVTSTGYFSGEGREPSFYKIQSGEFYPKRAVSLLNMYLMALYGNGSWVDGYCDNQFYLNHGLVKEHNLDIDEVREKCALFLMDMQGIQDAYTQQHILLHNTNGPTDRLRRGFSPQYSGDIFVEIVPGWEIVYEDKDNTREYVRHNAVPAPFMLLAPNVPAQKIDEPIDVTQIAPTIARILRIRSPNGSKARPVSLVR